MEIYICCLLPLPTHFAKHNMIPVGQSQFLTTPVPAKPLAFNLALDDQTHDYDHDFHSRYNHSYFDQENSSTAGRLEDSDTRLMEMLAAQAAHREVEPV